MRGLKGLLFLMNCSLLYDCREKSRRPNGWRRRCSCKAINQHDEAGGTFAARHDEIFMDFHPCNHRIRHLLG